MQTARELDDSWNRFESAVDALKGLKKGRLRVALVTTAKYFLPRMLGASLAAEMLLTGRFLHDREALVQAVTERGAGSWVLTPLVQKQIDARAAKEGITVQQANHDLLDEKQPSLQFTTPEELGELAVFFCSPAANNVRGVAWNMDGGWAAQ